MYLWNVKVLAEELKENRVSEKEQVKYYLFNAILALVSVESSIWDILGLACILIAGIIWCYRMNQQGDNRDFVVRMTCLSVPIMVRIIIFSTIITITVAIVMMLVAKLILGFSWSEIRSFTHSCRFVIEWCIVILGGITYFAWTRFCLRYISNT